MLSINKDNTHKKNTHTPHVDDQKKMRVLGFVRDERGITNHSENRNPAGSSLLSEIPHMSSHSRASL